MDRYRTLSKFTFKIDCLDFISMTSDKEKINGSLIERKSALNLYTNHRITAIYTSHHDAMILKDDFKNKPKLITISKCINQNHHPSDLGDYMLESVGYGYNTDCISSDFINKNNGKYVAELAGIFRLKTNYSNIWNEFCTKGLFNIWNPAAPYNRLNKSDYQVNPFKYILDTMKYDTDNENKKYRNIHQLNDPMILLLRLYKLNKEDVYNYEDINVRKTVKDIIEPRKVLLNNPVINEYDFNCIYSNIIDTLDKLKVSIPKMPPNLPFRYLKDNALDNYGLKYINPA